MTTFPIESYRYLFLTLIHACIKNQHITNLVNQLQCSLLFVPRLVTVEAFPPAKRQLLKIADISDTIVDSAVATELPRNELKLQTCAPMTNDSPPP
jgi:hypothetical protein